MNYKQAGWLIGGVLILLAISLFGVASVAKNKTPKSDIATINNDITTSENTHIVSDLDIQPTQATTNENVMVLLSADTLKHTSVVETKGTISEKCIYKMNGTLYYAYKITVEDITNKVDYFVSSDSFEKYDVGQVFNLEMYKTKDTDGNIFYSVKALKV